MTNIYNNKANAFGSTLHFCQHTNPTQKMQKSYQANAPRHSKMDRQTTTKKKGEVLTAPTKNWRFGASYNSFVVQQTLVLRINICGENRQLLLAANRYGLSKSIHNETN